MMTAVPTSSNPGRPARPVIWMISCGSYSWYPRAPAQYRVLLITTSCAGRFTPSAKVEVEQRIRTAPIAYASSTPWRSHEGRPAWW